MQKFRELFEKKDNFDELLKNVEIIKSKLKGGKQFDKLKTHIKKRFLSNEPTEADLLYDILTDRSMKSSSTKRFLKELVLDIAKKRDMLQPEVIEMMNKEFDKIINKSKILSEKTVTPEPTLLKFYLDPVGLRRNKLKYKTKDEITKALDKHNIEYEVYKYDDKYKEIQLDFPSHKDLMKAVKILKKS